MRYLKIICISIMLIMVSYGWSFAHFGMVIPSDNMVMQTDPRKIKIQLSFSHPFEMIGMPLDIPKRYFFIKDGKQTDLSPTLKEIKIMDYLAWEHDLLIKRPGVYTFIMEPKPYFEPAEDRYIIHYTKTIVAAFGDDEGWDQELGLSTEIVPLAKPFGLYRGNIFQGVVKLDGKSVPFAEVEVEYYNEKKAARAPADYMITQTIKADKNGVFSYAAPVSGWWGFAALNASDKKMKYDGVDKEIELGAVIWVKFEDWQTN